MLPPCQHSPSRLPLLKYGAFLGAESHYEDDELCLRCIQLDSDPLENSWSPLSSSWLLAFFFLKKVNPFTFITTDFNPILRDIRPTCSEVASAAYRDSLAPPFHFWQTSRRGLALCVPFRIRHCNKSIVTQQLYVGQYQHFALHCIEKVENPPWCPSHLPL